MSRYTGPAWKVSRRLGFSTLETGRELAKRPYAPGQHGPDRRKKLTEYGKQLVEKQKVRDPMPADLRHEWTAWRVLES